MLMKMVFVKCSFNIVSKNTLSSYNLKIVKQKNGSTINSVGHTKSNILVLSYITLPYKKGGWVGG